MQGFGDTFLDDFGVFWVAGGGGTPSGTTFWGQAVAADPQAAERLLLVCFCMDLGLHFGSPGDRFAVVFGDVFPVFFGCGPGSSFGWILAPFLEVFGVFFAVFS